MAKRKVVSDMLKEVSQLPLDILQGLVAGMEDGVILTDEEERIIFANKAVRRILQMEDKMEDGIPFGEVCRLVSLQTGKDVENPLQTAMQEKRAVLLGSDTGVCLSSGKLYLAVTCFPLRKGRNVMGCAVVLRDETHLRQTEMKMEADYRYMCSVFTAASIGLCVLNAEGSILEINGTAMEIMETSHRAAVGMQFGDAFRCENSVMHGCGQGRNCRHCPVRKNIEAAIMDDEFTGDFTVAMHSDHGENPVWLKVIVSQSWLGEEKRIIVAMMDVSGQKKREREVMNLLDAVLTFLSKEPNDYSKQIQIRKLRRLKEGR